MNELKVIHRHFGCIATSLDDGTNIPFEKKLEIIQSWVPSASKVKVFSRPVPAGRGITFGKFITAKPSLKAILDDFYLAIRTPSPIVLSPPSVEISPICVDVSGYAESKNMGISWAFYAYSNPSDIVPTVIGLTPPVAKILAQEIPEDVFFEDGKWQEWLFRWIKKYMQAHRYFDATKMSLISTPKSAAPVVVTADSAGECICEVKKARGRQKKVKQ